MSRDSVHNESQLDQARAYVLANFDRALREGHIKVSFQPIVRSFTKKLSHRENVWVHHAALPGSATSRSEHLSITSAMRLSTLRKP